MKFLALFEIDRRDHQRVPLVFEVASRDEVPQAITALICEHFIGHDGDHDWHPDDGLDSSAVEVYALAGDGQPFDVEPETWHTAREQAYNTWRAAQETRAREARDHADRQTYERLHKKFEGK